MSVLLSLTVVDLLILKFISVITFQSTMATKWGICSAGNIAREFVNALVSLPKAEHEVGLSF